MPYDPDKHHRRSVRLPDFDYSSEGAYFVTIVTQNRVCHFGEVVGGEMRLGVAGQMIEKTWLEIPANYPGARVDRHVVMPNHIHGVLILGDISSPTEGEKDPLHQKAPNNTTSERGTDRQLALDSVIGRFKSLTTHRYIDGVKKYGWPKFEKRFWQRNYHEHVIRDERDWIRIIEYIDENPARWDEDPENPRSVSA